MHNNISKFPTVFHNSSTFTKHLCASCPSKGEPVLICWKCTVSRAPANSANPVRNRPTCYKTDQSVKTQIRQWKQITLSCQAWSTYSSVHYAEREPHWNWKIPCTVKGGVIILMLTGLRVLWIPRGGKQTDSWAFLPCGLSTECPWSVESPVHKLY